MRNNQKIIKNIISKHTIPQPLIRSNEVKITKKIKNDSSHSFSNIASNKHLENTFKDSLEGSISESKTNILIPDSLNNTKSSLGNPNAKRKKNNNNHHHESEKNKNISNGEKIEKEDNFSSSKNNEDKTKKIDYRYYTNYPLTIINSSINTAKTKEKKRYWLAVYDKLIKKNKLLKIVNYYKEENNKNINMIMDINQKAIKEQLLIIKDFDIYFLKKQSKPFIKYIKGNCIFTKLYLLTIEEINCILNYINRYKLSFSTYNINFLQKKGDFQKLNEKYNNFPYNMVYHMGNYMNISIYAFSNYSLQENNSKISTYYLNQKFPNSKKISNLVKILLIHFPKYSFNFFVCYLLSKIRFENFDEKANEIKNLVYSGKKSILPLQNGRYNNIINNSIMHSSYSPLSHYDDDISNDEKTILKNYTENNYQQIIGKNMTFQYHTIDNYNFKYYNNKKKNNIINYVNNNKNAKSNNNSEKRRPLKKHTESVYLNGYIGKENTLLFNKEKNDNIKEQKNSIKKIFDNFKINPSLDINENSKTKRIAGKANNINKIKSYSKNNKITFPNFVHVKKKNTNYIENGILNKIQKEKDGKKYIEEYKYNNKTNKAISKIMICTKSEETKIGTTNKEITNYINNSYKDEINKENTGIFVVNKRMITDIHDYNDDNSSLALTEKNQNGKSSSIYMTPEKKKKYRYYS